MLPHLSGKTDRLTAPELRLLVQHMAVKALVMLLQVGSAARQSDYLVCFTHIFHKWTGQMAVVIIIAWICWSGRSMPIIFNASRRNVPRTSPGV